MMRILHGLWQESKTGLGKEGDDLPAAGNLIRSSPRKLFRYHDAVERRTCFQFVGRTLALLAIPRKRLSPA